MTVTLEGELIFFAASLLFGLLAGVLYDAFRFLRTLLGIRAPKAVRAPSSPNNAEAQGKTPSKKRGLPVGHIFTGFADFGYVVSVGVLYILLIYAVHSGIFRFYSLFALLLGIFLYLKTISHAVLFFLLPLAGFFRRVLQYVFYPLYKPLLLICRIFLKILCKMRCFSQKNVLKYKQRRQNKRGEKSEKNKMKSPASKPTAKCGVYSFGKRETNEKAHSAPKEKI